MNRILTLALIGALGACSNEPAGGRGPFDPQALSPVQERYPSTIVAPPANATLQPQPIPQVQASSDPLVQDVNTALNTTAVPAPASALAPGPAVGEIGNPGIGIDPNDQSLNLALSSQEQQKIEREEAERRRIAAQQQLVVIPPEATPQVNANANVVQYARSTTHSVGDKVYKRDLFRSRAQSNSACRGFKSNDEAQRQFLANGGPQTDRYNLDPDGDGFACGFSPDLYRKLNF